MQHPLIDQLDAWMVLVGTIALFWLASEVGFRLGRGHFRRKRREEADRAREAEARGEEEEAQKKSSQVGILVAALLGLLGLLLAFSFSIVESRFSARKQLVLQEANAIGTAYLRAEMLPEPQGAAIRDLLRQYVELRTGPQLTPEKLPDLLERSEELHFELWREAEVVAEENPESEIVGLFVASLNDVIDLHQERLTMALYYRLPVFILGTLYLVALLGVGLMGYSSGLTRARLSMPTIATVGVISVVLLLVIELDRPWQRVFQVNQQSLEDVQQTIASTEEEEEREEETE